MRTLNPAFSIHTFFDKLSKADKNALLLDYDGTLAPFKKSRNKAFPYSGVRDTLNKIQGSDKTRLIIITGRAVKDIIQLLGLKELPEIWGSHGWERLMPDGRYELWVDKDASTGIKRLSSWLEHEGFSDICEEKPAGIAIHFRGLKEDYIKKVKNRLSENLQSLTADTGLSFHRFDGGLEFRLPGKDKGFAVRTVLSEMGGDVIMAYLGDDLTDEDAFRAIKGKGLGVLVRRELRKTDADIWLKPPDELLEFLNNWHRICEV